MYDKGQKEKDKGYELKKKKTRIQVLYTQLSIEQGKKIEICLPQ